MLAVWLREQHSHASQQSHCHALAATLAKRREGRAYLLTLDGGAEFSESYERQRRDNEPEEPEGLR